MTLPHADPIPTREVSPSTGVLYRAVARVATVARAQMRWFWHHVWDPDGDVVGFEEVRQVSESLAFQALAELYGVPEDPTTFDWSAVHYALVGRTIQLLRREVRGRTTRAGDRRRKGQAVRLDHRPDHDLSPQLQVPFANPTDDPRPDILEATLLGAMTRVLRHDDVVLLTTIYLEGVPQRELARRLVTSGRYPDTVDGLRRAEVAINTRVWRARQRAAERLGPEWAAVCQQVVAS